MGGAAGGSGGGKGGQSEVIGDITSRTGQSTAGGGSVGGVNSGYVNNWKSPGASGNSTSSPWLIAASVIGALVLGKLLKLI
jgi:hypothetical protein